MALTEWNATEPAFDPARGIAARTSLPAVPHDALGRLPGLYREQARDLALAKFLARSPLACVALMLAGAAALLLSGASLKAGFGWSVLILIGISAIIRNHVRGAARTLRRVPLAEAAGDLRLLLLYGGMAWASGAYLLMPDLPNPVLAFGFAVIPALALSLILKDAKGCMAFTAPVCLGVAGAAILGAWPQDLWLATVILAAGFGIILLPALQQNKNTPAAPTLRI